jgi:predicted acyltransferase
MNPDVYHDAATGGDARPQTSPNRWEALDLLRGLSIIGMLLSLTPGAWNLEYTWLTHVKWEGGHLIDMVAPAFLFCVGAAIPFSFRSRLEKGATKRQLAAHILWRALALVVVGLFLNAYPVFDWAHLRLPGVLQRIGVAFAMAGGIVLLTTRTNHAGQPVFSPALIAGAAVFIVVSYWALLYFVPVPGFGAPRFDPVGSWPPFIDRAVFTVPHLFIYWPVDGKVVFDPDGLVNIYPTCANILIGVLAGILYQRRSLRHPMLTAVSTGAVLMILAVVFNGLCPIIKNIWTSTFVLFSSGFTLVLLAILMITTDHPRAARPLFPVRVYGANPLLAYLIRFLFDPLLDMKWIPNAQFGKVSLRWGSQIISQGIIDPSLASFLFSIAYLIVLFFILWFFYRKRWFLRL